MEMFAFVEMHCVSYQIALVVVGRGCCGSTVLLRTSRSHIGRSGGDADGDAIAGLKIVFFDQCSCLNPTAHLFLVLVRHEFFVPFPAAH
jgi:hypothetical protein